MAVDKQTRDNIWTLIAAPLVWALHFLFAYAAAAYACAPNDVLFAELSTVRVAIGLATLLALAVIGYGLRRAAREWYHHGGGYRHDRDTPEDRERFLEFSTVLLAALSLVGVVFNLLPVLFIADCR